MYIDPHSSFHHLSSNLWARESMDQTGDTGILNSWTSQDCWDSESRLSDILIYPNVIALYNIFMYTYIYLYIHIWDHILIHSYIYIYVWNVVRLYSIDMWRLRPETWRHKYRALWASAPSLDTPGTGKDRQEEGLARPAACVIKDVGTGETKHVYHILPWLNGIQYLLSISVHILKNGFVMRRTSKQYTKAI